MIWFLLALSPIVPLKRVRPAHCRGRTSVSWLRENRHGFGDVRGGANLLETCPGNLSTFDCVCRYFASYLQNLRIGEGVGALMLVSAVHVGHREHEDDNSCSEKRVKDGYPVQKEFRETIILHKMFVV